MTKGIYMGKNTNWEFDWDMWHKNYQSSEILSFKVSGINYENEDGISRIDVISKMDKYSAIDIISEPFNKYDKNALAVYSKYGKIGYVPKNYIDDVNELMQSFCLKKATIHDEGDNLYVIVDIMVIDNTENHTPKNQGEKISFHARLSGVKDNNEDVFHLNEGDELFADLDFQKERIIIAKDEYSFGSPIGYVSGKIAQNVFELCKENALKNNFVFNISIAVSVVRIEYKNSRTNIIVEVDAEEIYDN